MPPRLVLVPGTDGTGLLFRPFTDLWPGPTTVLPLPVERAQDYAALIPWLQRCLPTGEPFVLLGESFAGPLVLGVAASPPPGLLGIILCVSFARSPFGPAERWVGTMVRPSLIPRLPRALVRWSLRGRWKSTELDALLDEVLDQLPPALAAARIRALATVDATPWLQALQRPLLVLSAQSDALLHRSCPRYLVRQAPAAQWVELPGPHLLLQTQATLAAEAISRFLSNLPTPGH